MTTEELLESVINSLDEGKARDLKTIDMDGKTSVTDYMVIATGTSERHLRSLANNVVENAKKQKVRPLGVEGQNSGEWILVDLGDVVVHVMLMQTRQFYQLEKLWEVDYNAATMGN